MSSAEKKLLVLDLDETLVFATKANMQDIPVDFTIYDYNVYKRPNLEYFITEAANHFTLAIWSSASDDYVETIVNNITPPNVSFAAIWGRSKCSRKWNANTDEYYFEKRLDKFKKRGFTLDNILIVDDSAEKVTCNYGNAVYITAFWGNSLDNELNFLLKYLLTLKDAQNVRAIEKRFWRMSH